MGAIAQCVDDGKPGCISRRDGDRRAVKHDSRAVKHVLGEAS